MAPKRLNLNTDDKLVGVRPREMRDYYAGCNEPGQPAHMPDAHAFMQTFCARCRRLDCVRAKSVVHAWERRMAAQPDWLINDPLFSDLTDPRHQQIAQTLFEDMRRKAERLEIAAIRQDWEIPEGPSDGFAAIQSSETTSAVDIAVKELARARGQVESAPSPIDAPKVDAPPFFEEAKDDVEYETQFPSTSRRGVSYRVALEDGRWSCECAGFQHVGRCKHLNEVRPWYEANKDAPPEPEIHQPASPPRAPPTANDAQQVVDPRLPPPPRPLNTPMPPRGVMVGEGVPSPAAQRSGSPAVEPDDPWTPRRDTVVESGATLKPPPKK